MRNQRTGQHLASTATVAFVLTLAAPAHARQVQTETVPAATPATAQTETQPQDEARLQDIIVTAQRREENLQRTALAVSAVSGDALLQANVADVTTLSKVLPSLDVQPSAGPAFGLYVRGVGASVGNLFTDNPVAFNYGQVYIARPTALLGTFYDLERVELLKGPQGTLYGRNATGGAINVIPRRPELGQRGLNLSIEAGNYEAVQTQAALNLPLGESAALRIAGNVARHSGYLSDGYDDQQGQAVRASLLFKPGPIFSTLISADYFHQGGRGPGGVVAPSTVTPAAPPLRERIGGADPRSVAVLTAAFPPLVGSGLIQPPRTDGFVDSNFWGVSAVNDLDLGFARLTLIPAHRYSHTNYLTYSAGYYGRVNEVDVTNSVEARLASTGTGPFSYIIGGYYYDEDQRGINNFRQGPLVDTTFRSQLNSRSYAVFGQATFALVPSFRLAVGGRYTWEDKDNDTTLQQTSFGVGPTSRSVAALSFKRFTYKGGFEWDAGAQNLVYANVATGFKSGGFFVAAFDNTFAPEKLTAYTLGSKNRFLGNRLQINLEGFYWQYSDQQVSYIGPARTSATTVGAALITTNVGKSRIYGAEADIVFKPTRDDLIGLNFQYLNGRYIDFRFLAVSSNGAPLRTTCATTPSTALTFPPPARPFTVDCSGKPQISSPKLSISADYAHTFPLTSDFDLVAGAHTKFQTSKFVSIEFLPEQRQGSYALTDAYLTLANRSDRYSITAFVNNLTDKTVITGGPLRPVLSTVYNFLNPPRTYGVRFSGSF